MQPTFGTDYSFRWEDLGDIRLGRPNLGGLVPVAIYRLALYTMRETMVQHHGEEAASTFLREAGWVAGREFCTTLLDRALPVPAFIDRFQQVLKEQKIGILRLEKADLTSLVFTMTMSEDLDCSGLAVRGRTVCEYDEGFIAGVLHAYTGKDFEAAEIDCWATGDRTCRFTVNPSAGPS